MSQPIPVALVTGASRGLGRGIACQLSTLGFSVAVNYVSNLPAAEQTVTLCKERQSVPEQKFVALRANVAVAEDRHRFVEETLKHFGRIDALVNNAGMGPRMRVDVTETTEESFAEVLRVNLDGPFFLTQLVVNHWLQKKTKPLLQSGFKVIFISSISANTVSLNRAEYCISKAGLAMVTQLWAVRLAEEGIQVYELRPGIMATDMTEKVKDVYNKKLAEGLVPQKRWGEAEDVGLAVGTLLTGQFPYSTGEVIYLDGGMNIRRL